MSDGWPEGAVDFVQALADTKLVMSQRYAEWMLSGPVLEDDIAGANAAQDEIGHVRQLFRQLSSQGREDEWLEGDRDPSDVANAPTLDDDIEGWVNYVTAMDVTERATWYLVDAIVDDDFTGLGDRIGQDEYFHLEHLDGRLETLANERPEELQEALETYLPGALALLGPPSYDDDADPLLEAGFTDRSVAEIREAYRAKYESLFEGTDVSIDGVDWDAPTEDEWDESRRRVGDGSISQETLDSLRGVRSAEYAMD